jgi:twitching motility protein PilT
MTTRKMPVSLDEIVDLALEVGASDIHFKPDMAPVLRVDGKIRSIPGMSPIPAADLKNGLLGLCTPKQLANFERDQELDTALVFPGKARVRVNIYTEIEGVGCAMRLVPLEVPSVQALGLPPVIENLTRNRSGLILVTGVTGAGKSTTLAAMIDAINQREALHVYTMEDPVEFVHRSKKSVFTQREIGTTTKSFGSALRSALRADPNVLLIGEMRDAETILAAIKAAETGHLVFSTLHTSSAPKTIQRILSVFPPAEQEAVRQQLAYTLKAVVAQQLVPLIDGGRMAIHEILVVTLTIQEAILRGDIDSIPEYIKNGGFDGMQTMDSALYNAYHDGFIDGDTAKSYSLNSGEMERILRGATMM